MDRRLLALTTVILTVGCAGQRPAAPASGPAPAPAPAPPRDPSILRYVTGSAHYRVEQESHVVQDVMGQMNSADLSSHQLLSTVVSDSGANLALAVTVDSLDVTAPPQADLSGLSAARGQTFRLLLEPSGLVLSVSAPDTANTILRQFTSGLRDFLPRIPSGPIAPGQSWTDTVTTTNGGDISVTTVAVREHRVVGWEDRDGVRALHLARTSTYSVSGSGQAQGQPVEMSGGGQSLRDSFVSAAGVFLASIESDSALINANVTSVGITVPIHQTRRSTVTRVP
jgi:hypothetical protein